MRIVLYLAFAALSGGVWYALLFALGGIGLGPPPATALDVLAGWDLHSLAACVITSVLTAVALRRFVARVASGGRLMPVSLGFWTLGGALWPLTWMAIGVADHALRQGWGAALDDGGILFLALIAPYAGFGVAVLLIWIVWPLAALEVWLLARVLGPGAGPAAELPHPTVAGEPAAG